MSFSSRASALIAAFGAFLNHPVDFFKSRDMGHAGIPPVSRMHSAPVNRCRIPDSNRAEREHCGIPHGVSGAKLARKAMTGRITLRG